MNRPDSTEMDHLLRRFARRNNEAARAADEERRDGQDARQSVHLDADEMNAFAEGALPESARSRYFAHLADCDSCRKLVTELTLAATVAHEQKAHVASVTASPSKSWREWLAAIFSPSVLRYGVPALALLAVIVVAIVATRPRRDERFVAEQKEAPQTSASSVTSNSNSTTETTTTTTATTAENHADNSAPTSNTSASAPPPQNPASQADAAGKPVQEKDGTILAQSQPVPQPEVAKSAEEQRSSNTKQAQTAETGRVLDEAAPATAAPPAPTPTPATAPATTAPAADNKREERKRAQDTESDDQVKTANAVGGAAGPLSIASGARDSTSRRASRTTQNLPATKPAQPPKSNTVDAEKDKEPPAELRNVKGHRFRRQGGAWVDVTYNSSRSTVNVPRGSEQYRALVADEPELRTITQQLGGEVIVVWKGRAYRFY